MKITAPEINPKFFYGPVVSYEFNGDISKDKGKYRIRFTLTFKSGVIYPTQKSGFRTEAEARKAKEVLIADLVRNDYIPFDYTVKEFFDYWLYYYMIEECKIRYNTFQSYKNILYNHLLPAIGETKKLGGVSVNDIADAICGIQYPSVREKSAKTIKLVMEFACTNHYISFNPSLAAIEQVKKRIPQKGKRVVVPYTVGEIKTLLYICKRDFPDMYYPLLLSLTTGMRISETIGLKYADIDLPAGNIYVKRQLGRDMNRSEGEYLVSQELETKTPNGVRLIPISAWVADEIIMKKAWYETQKQFVPDFQDNGYICCHCDGTPYNRKSFHKDFHALLNMCGLRDIHWHDLRHMYATILKNSEVNKKAISKFLGHYDVDFTDETYISHEETASDCTILSEVWEEIHPAGNETAGAEESFLPFAEKDYISFLS